LETKLYPVIFTSSEMGTVSHVSDTPRTLREYPFEIFNPLTVSKT